jgi:hypothetical protein
MDSTFEVKDVLKRMGFLSIPLNGFIHRKINLAITLKRLSSFQFH